MSPLYNEAMVLAQKGVDAAGIAGQCGISIGEAELVAALSRDSMGLRGIEDDHGGYANSRARH